MSMVGAMPGYRLFVHIVRAEGLNHMNHFTGDHPYCVCDVQHIDKTAQATKVETQPVTSGDTLNPVWDEAWEIEPWLQGEALEFTVYDKGLIGSKTEGKVVLSSETFFPNGFSGMLSLSGLQNATLQVEVQVVGTVGGAAVPVQLVGTAGGAEVPVPVPTIMNYGAPPTYSNFGPSYTYNAPQASQMMHAAPPMVAYAAAPQAPQMMHAAPPMVAYAAAPQPMTFMAQQQPMTYAAAPACMVPTYPAASQPTVLPMPAEAAPLCGDTVVGPQKLAVSILQAHGLQHMNHFTGDHPYVTCEVKGVDGHSHTKVQTKPVTEGDTTNPFWGETLTVDPWNLGENLEFTVYDKGLIGSKTEGKVMLPQELFYPNGFSGMLLISGLPHALLHVIVRPLGLSSKETAMDGATLGETSSKKTKKLKTGKKQKDCC